jgi:co-chaperonin GroES (HSP10)
MNNNIELIGDRIWIRLEEAKDHTTTESGILIPLNELTETDGGRVSTRPSDKKHLLKGIVVAVADYASSKLKEVNVTLSPNDEVYISKHALNPSYAFYPNRDQLVIDFTGDICIPHNFIEAKITK